MKSRVTKTQLEISLPSYLEADLLQGFPEIVLFERPERSAETLVGVSNLLVFIEFQW